MKPSRQDGCASDDEVNLEDELPYGAKKEVNIEMINLMWDLDDEDPNDKDWLPQGIQKREQGIGGNHQFQIGAPKP